MGKFYNQSDHPLVILIEHFVKMHNPFILKDSYSCLSILTKVTFVFSYMVLHDENILK